MKKLKSAQRILLIGLCFLLFIVSIAVGSYAYFKTDLRVNGYANVKIELLFDMLDETARTEYQKGVESEEKITLKESDKIWGHKGNPYVISAPRHLQNLSTLQNIGYFKAKFLNSNYSADGTLRGDSNYSDGYNIPYFLVSDVKGKPVVIDASKETIKPVGDDKYPFVGSVKGVSGVQTDDAGKVVGTITYAEKLINGNKTSTSAIHGVKVEDNSGKLDFGFFGKISCLGDPSNTIIDADGKDTGTFVGMVSTVADLLFSDVQIKVENSFWDIIKDLFSNHTFYKTLSGTDSTKDPKEDHHLGIVAAHVEYSNFINISVYYSRDDIPAFDLRDTTKNALTNKEMNYYSATGIFGFLYSLNPKEESGKIVVGSGTSNSNISYGLTGGGGKGSGDKTGYFYAQDIFGAYTPPLDGEGNVQGNYTIGTQGTLTDQNDALVYNFDAKGTITDADGKEKYKLTAEKLIKDANGAIQYTYAEFSSGDIRFEIKDLSGNTQYTCDNYGGIREGKTTTGDVLYNFDGTNVTTTDGSGSVTIKYTVADGKVTEQKTGNFVYVFGTFNVVKSKNSIAYTYDADGNITDSTGNISYTYDKTAGTIAGNGVIYRVNTETVVLDTNKDTVYKVDADNTVRDPKGTILYRVYTDPVSGAKSVIDAKKSNNDNQVFVLNTNGDLLIQNAKNKDGESLLQEWEAYRGNTSIYGFYDGVFTFALSSGTDSIKNIWPDYADGSGGTSSPVFSLGEDSDDAWKIDKLPDGFEYYYEMEEVKNHTSFNSADDNYLITWTDSATREIYLMDLNTPGTKVGAIALSSLGGIISTSETALRITWDSISARSNLDKYWIGINGTSVKSKYSNHPLGIQRTTFNWGLFENDSSFDIYCGENENKKPSFLSYGYYYSYDVVINYNNGFQLSLTNKKTRYVEGSSSGFSFGEDSSYYGLKIYRMTKRGVQEQTSDKYGYKPIDEVNSDSEGNLLYANQHVLSPKSTALVEDTTSTYENGAYNYPVYELQSVSSLGWKDAQGNSLSTVSKMLNMGEGITWDIQFDVLGGLIDTSANNKLVNAPIGSKGETTNIPIGCLAFRINKVPEGGAKIRVITACPSTKSYGSLKTDEDYYFGIWKSETKTFLGGLIKYNVFSKTNAIEKFELPRSQAKAMGEAGADGVPTKTEEGLKDYIRIQYGDKTYRTYLQGDIYLIAYEFTVSEEGIYIMGASNGPMQIVYFSSDGVSDDGRDGTGGTQIGFVDFVYDYSPTTATDPKRIVLVTDTELKHTGNKTDTEDYQYYYESNCLVHFGNAQGEPPIWDELVYIRRRRFETVSPDDKEIWLSVSAYSDDLNESVQCSKYALLGDNIGYWNSETTAPIEGVKYGKRSVSTGE